jgi:hypothetical protein
MKSVSDIDKYLNALEAANRFSGVILIHGKYEIISIPDSIPRR